MRFFSGSSCNLPYPLTSYGIGLVNFCSSSPKVVFILLNCRSMMNAPAANIGQPLSRPDGRLKVTGSARYTAEWAVPDLAYGAVVDSAIARGAVKSIDTSQVERLPGVIAVVTHLNAPRLLPLPEKIGETLLRGEGGMSETRQPLQDAEIQYAGQPLAVVVADTLERARYAATLVRVTYDEQVPELSLEEASVKTLPPSFVGNDKGEKLQVNIGDPTAALAAAPVRLECRYETPIQHHNPIETNATIARWEKKDGADALTLFETSRYLQGTQEIVAKCLDLPKENVQVICHFMGGSFGAKGWQWANPLIAALSARVAECPVKIEWRRQEMFAIAGQRSRTLQTLNFGATPEGKITALRHDSRMHSSISSGYTEPCARMTRMMYDVPNIGFSHQLSHLNLPSPCPVRGPGEMPGAWALECALDELAHELKIDPIELRLINYAEKNPETGQPWSSKHLRECYARGKKLIGWDARNPAPRSTREGNSWVGYGMATSMYPAARRKASARATIYADGRAVVESATHDHGNGAYTIFRQIAADGLAIPIDKVRFELGDSKLPSAPATGGSATTASVGPAVLEAARDAVGALKRLAIRDSKSPLYGASEAEIEAKDGHLFLKANSRKGEDYGAILRRAKLSSIGAGGESGPGEEREKFSFFSFGAVFAKVRVDEETGTIRVDNLAAVYDGGRVMNPKTARSQFIGGMTFSMGLTLMEATEYDPNNGRAVIRNLADYHIPCMADTPEFAIEWLDIPDPHINELGARGFGEIGMVGTPAAITNAVFHATGKRLRSLPLTPDKLI
jgi:xanthine dehydrogenase YagR molybdenum-binding subunit